ncbi:unnamed protein product [Caenorhabditis bovis]|uniref:Uncharacterized protein n=1 Tax=Caenorhabditis bovis TaxID=2654633 RepID=A0A8S1FCN2_9PELO|nr:unnamed protein product [Caenorhabditis bovis]
MLTMSASRSLFILVCALIVVYAIPVADVYGSYEFDDQSPYLMNLLKRTAVFLPNGNQDKIIKAILKSRRY